MTAIPKPQKRKRDPAYMKFVRTLPCSALNLGPCSGGVIAHHAGIHPGWGRKADDDTCVALCNSHHMALHALSGDFRGFCRETLRIWQDEAISGTRALHEQLA